MSTCENLSNQGDRRATQIVHSQATGAPKRKEPGEDTPVNLSQWLTSPGTSCQSYYGTKYAEWIQ